MSRRVHRSNHTHTRTSGRSEEAGRRRSPPPPRRTVPSVVTSRHRSSPLGIGRHLSAVHHRRVQWRRAAPPHAAVRPPRRLAARLDIGARLHFPPRNRSTETRRWRWGVAFLSEQYIRVIWLRRRDCASVLWLVFARIPPDERGSQPGGRKERLRSHLDEQSKDLLIAHVRRVMEQRAADAALARAVLFAHPAVRANHVDVRAALRKEPRHLRQHAAAVALSVSRRRVRLWRFLTDAHRARLS